MNAAAFALILLAARGGGFDESIDGLRGLVRRAPVAAASVLVVLLALTGIPPTAGFMGKYFLFTAAVGKGMVLLAAAGRAQLRPCPFSITSASAGPCSSRTRPRPPARRPEALSRLVTAFLALAAAALLLLGLLPGLLTAPALRAVLGG
ncbi:MAG: hypothetical protein MZV64_18135 [Ignavibacteriales bacterium]|nr:hypothetical protein [Ignavibacteriales bacterium]